MQEGVIQWERGRQSERIYRLSEKEKIQKKSHRDRCYKRQKDRTQTGNERENQGVRERETNRSDRDITGKRDGGKQK